MRISKTAWAKYQQAHRRLQEAAKEEFRRYFESLPWETDENRALRLLLAKAAQLVQRYGGADASLSAGMYDEIMYKQGARVPPAVVSVPSAQFVVQDVRDAYQRALTHETALQLMSSAVSGHVKRAGVQTMRNAARRDGAQWAWVCVGDSCAFCRAIGSNGWQYASRKVLDGDHAEHIHDNCDCQFMVRKPGQALDVDGYDPDALLGEYRNAHGNSRERINEMRRNDYTQEFADKRNARRRELRAQAHKADEAATK